MSPAVRQRGFTVRPRPAESWLSAAIAVLALAVALCLGLQGSQWPDWSIEAAPSIGALLGGHLSEFFRLAPTYGGSLLMRAPFIALTRLSGGGGIAIYRAGALPCLLADVGLALWLSAELRRRGGALASQAATIAVCVAGPFVVFVLQQGHPEDLLGAVLCVAAVLCAQRDRPILSGVLVGLAIANKEWGLLAVGPALVALPRRHLRALVAMGAAGGAVLAPFVLVRAGGFVSQTATVALHSVSIFNPWQLWWFLGSPGPDGTRIGPAWLAGLGHTLPILAMGPLTLAYAIGTRRNPNRRRVDALLLLVLLLLLRCALDPWDTVYYPLPFLTALLAWEVTSRDRAPLLTLVATLLCWFVFEGATEMFTYDRDLFGALFLVVSVPALCLIGLRLFTGTASTRAFRLPARSARPARPPWRVRPAWLDSTTPVALLILAVTARQGFHGSSWSDWTSEARPSVDALLAGHVARFFQLAPVYGGSLLLRSPFMALTKLWDGGALAVYRMSALPCLAAVAALAIWLNGDMKRRGCGLTARMAAVIVCTWSPLAVLGLRAGHPEELLGAVLCAAAVLCAQRDRAVWSGILLGLAIANKEWGVLALGPVLIALPSGRARALASMTVTAGLLLAPFVLIRAGGFVGQSEAVALHAGGIFSPFQLWWNFGAPVAGGTRIGPAWVAQIGHTLPIALMVPLSAAFALCRRGADRRRRSDAMLLLSLLLLLRCALDPWDAVYYPVPFLIAILSWEATAFERPPYLAAVASLAAWFACDGAVTLLGGDQNRLAMSFALIVVPAIALIGLRLLGPATPSARTVVGSGGRRPFALPRG